MGDFNPQTLPSRGLQTLWEWKNRVLLEEYCARSFAMTTSISDFGHRTAHRIPSQMRFFHRTATGGGGVLGETRVDMVATGPLHQPGGMDMAPSVVHCVNTSARQYINVHLTVHSRHVTAHSLWYVVSLLFLAVCHGSRHAIAAALSL